MKANALQRVLEIFVGAMCELNSDAQAQCYHGFFLVLLAHELGNALLRDEALRTIGNTNDPAQARSRSLPKRMQRCLAAGDERPFPFDEFEAMMQEAPLEDQANLNYFAARFSQSRGQISQARQYYEKSAAADQAGHVIAELSARAFAELK